MKRPIKRPPIGSGIGTRRFEQKRLRHRQLDVNGRIFGRVARDVLESGQSIRDGVDIQRVELGTTACACVKRREQRRERDGLLLGVNALNGSDELIALTFHILHVRRPVRLYAKRFSDIGHRTLQAVVRNRHIRPDGLDKRLFGDDVTGIGDQNEKNSQVAAEERHRIGAVKQSLTG